MSEATQQQGPADPFPAPPARPAARRGRGRGPLAWTALAIAGLLAIPVLSVLVNVFAPDVFAIGGQIAKAGKWLMDPAVEQAERVAIPSLFADCRIAPAVQIDDAGVLGAAAVAWEAQK